MSFGKDLEREYEAIIKQRDLILKESAVGLYADVVDASPVDTGELKRSWQLPVKIKDGWRISNIAPHASTIDGGRLFNGKMWQGSEQLPHGYAPVIKKAEKKLNERLKGIK